MALRTSVTRLPRFAFGHWYRCTSSLYIISTSCTPPLPPPSFPYPFLSPRSIPHAHPDSYRTLPGLRAKVQRSFFCTHTPVFTHDLRHARVFTLHYQSFASLPFADLYTYDDLSVLAYLITYTPTSQTFNSLNFSGSFWVFSLMVLSIYLHHSILPTYAWPVDIDVDV